MTVELEGGGVGGVWLIGAVGRGRYGRKKIGAMRRGEKEIGDKAGGEGRQTRSGRFAVGVLIRPTA